MNINIIKNLYKKEMLDVIRDKKTVLMMLVVPLVLYPLLMVVSLQVMVAISNDMSTQTYKIALDFEDENSKLQNMFQDSDEDGYSIQIIESENYNQLLLDGELDAYVTKETVDGKEQFNICYMSAVTNSSYVAQIIYEVFDKYANDITIKLIEDAGLSSEKILSPIDVEYIDYSTSEESAGSLMGTIIPFMLVVSLLMGTMYPAIDTTAGERERGTIETILTLPVSSSELIFSKFLTVATIGIISALLNVLSMCGVGAYMYSMVASVSEGAGQVDIKRFIPALIVCLLCIIAFAVFISAITMCVCAFAKTYKEANNYITPLSLVVMLASFIGFIPNIELTTNMALIPVVNICLLIRDLLLFKFNLEVIIVVLISNVIYGVVATVFLGKIYNSEGILFGDEGSTVQIFEKRANMKKSGVPSAGDGWLVVAVVALAMIYVGGMAQLHLGVGGVVVTQLMIMFIPILVSVYTKKSLVKTFKLNKCRMKYIVGGIFAIIGCILLGMILTAVTSLIFKSSAQSMAESTNSLMGDNIFIALIMVAVVPAICEEMMFRGYFFSAMESKYKYSSAIMLTGIIFGLYHMNIVQFFTTALIGIVICYFTHKSNSIFPGMIMHFINNGLACVVTMYPNQVGKVFPVLLKESLSVFEVIAIVIFGVAFVYLGVKYTTFDSKNNKIEQKNRCN